LLLLLKLIYSNSFAPLASSAFTLRLANLLISFYISLPKSISYFFYSETKVNSFVCVNIARQHTLHTERDIMANRPSVCPTPPVLSPNERSP